MREAVYNAIWGWAVRARNAAKRLGVLGPLEPLLLRLAPLVVRPPSEEVNVALAPGLTMTVPPGFPSARSYASGGYEPAVRDAFPKTKATYNLLLTRNPAGEHTRQDTR